MFWRAGSANCPVSICGFDSGITYRPVLYNFNAVYSPKLATHAYLELVGGLGALDTHYSECTLSGASCGGSQLISSSDHFDVDLGGGVKLYVHGGFFVRPEARFYWINNNTDFSSNHAARVGAASATPSDNALMSCIGTAAPRLSRRAQLGSEPALCKFIVRLHSRVARIPPPGIMIEL